MSAPHSANSQPRKEIRMRNDPWEDDEVQAAVLEYFEMMKSQERGVSVNKAELYRELSRRFPARSNKAFELKFQNISAVLDDMGRDYADGLKPRGHYQDLLRVAVVHWIRKYGSK